MFIYPKLLGKVPKILIAGIILIYEVVPICMYTSIYIIWVPIRDRTIVLKLIVLVIFLGEAFIPMPLREAKSLQGLYLQKPNSTQYPM